MTFKKGNYYTVIAQAKDLVLGFRDTFALFEERVVLDRLSKSLTINYGRNIAHLALHFGRVPHEISIEENNSYLYRKTVHENLSENYFKQTVFGMRFWFRLFGRDEQALKLPVIKKEKKQPDVLSKDECKQLFLAPRTLKHRFLLAFAYSTGLRMNELRHIKISDIDTDRMPVRVRQGKGKKDRYVLFSRYIKSRLPDYLKEVKPQVYLFEGQKPSLRRSIWKQP